MEEDRVRSVFVEGSPCFVCDVEGREDTAPVEEDGFVVSECLVLARGVGWFRTGFGLGL